MQYRKLGRTGIDVSAICLGTMTWGSQNSEAEAHAQIDYAIDHGVNFMDTAEAYPVTPSSAETRGRTEQYIGSWIKASGKRDKIVLATKVSGPMRSGNRLDRRSIERAIDNSLGRLQTDYVDLYQLHWPDRRVPIFGKRGMKALADDSETVAIEETLAALADLVAAGKVRHIGVSNESPWGVSEYLRLSGANGWPRIASIQNAYSLLNRTFENGLAEFALREDVGLLAYSPLAAGHLTGKYLGGFVPEGSRLAVASQFPRYENHVQRIASARYVAIARAHGMDPAQMALAYVNRQDFLTSTIVGATSLEQLAINIASIDLDLDETVLEAIEDVYRELPDPCP